MKIATYLESHYKHVERAFDVTSTGNYTSLVTPNGNHLEPIHRWFHFKEAYSHRLLQRVLKDEDLVSKTRKLRIYDPFTGSGTTVVSAGQLVQDGSLHSAHFTGTESNGFLHVLASAKMAALTRPPSDFLTFAGAVAAAAVRRSSLKFDLPSLSTFHNTDYFSLEAVNRIMSLRAAHDAMRNNASPATNLLVAICVAAAVEPASRLRRDGRTLRFAPTKAPIDPIAAFLRTAERVADDLSTRPVSLHGEIRHQDARQRTQGSSGGRADLAIFSPPYPNNIDYTEVYKLEAWALGILTSETEFSAQRRKTLRSHGSLRWDDVYSYEHGPNAQELESLLAPVLKAIPRNDRYYEARRQLVRGYTDDIYRVIENVRSALRPGGSMVCVVGNSLHGKPGSQFLVAADLVIATVASLIGLQVTRIEVARRPKRRASSSNYLRESVIFARRPLEEVG